MKTFKKIGCLIIGWNYDTLSQCGESSHRMLRKFLAAILIMSFLWGVIGYSFAKNYLGFESIGAIISSIVFITIIISIERIIILSGKSLGIKTFRIVLACLMAILGSCIIDQLIFREDIEDELEKYKASLFIEKKNTKLHTYNQDILRIQTNIDSLSQSNVALYEEIQNKPATIIPTYSTSEQITGIDANGNPIKTQVKNTSTMAIPNSKISQVETNNKLIDEYNTQLTDLLTKRSLIEEDVWNEIYNKKVGFVTELEATINVISHSWISLIFYIVLFGFLLSLECFVLTIKTGDSNCDYDLIIAHQMALKEKQLRNNELLLLHSGSLNPKMI